MRAGILESEHHVLVENGHSPSVVWSRLLTTGIRLSAGLPQLLAPSVHALGVLGWGQPWAVGDSISRHPLLQLHLLFTCVQVCTPATMWPFHVPIHEPSQGCSTEFLCPAGGSPQAGALPCPALPALSAVPMLTQAVPGAGLKASPGLVCSLATGLVSSCGHRPVDTGWGCLLPPGSFDDRGRSRAETRPGPLWPAGLGGTVTWSALDLAQHTPVLQTLGLWCTLALTWVLLAGSGHPGKLWIFGAQVTFV